MLIIRLQRIGKKHKPQFRIVLAEKQKAASKKIQEILGNYNPRTKEFSVKDKDRVQYWLDQNVAVSPTVHNLFVDHNVIEDKKVKAWQPKVKEQAGQQQAQAKEEPKQESSSAEATEDKEKELENAEETKEEEKPAEEEKSAEATKEEEPAKEPEKEAEGKEEEKSE